MWIRGLAIAAFVFALFRLFRLAMRLRYTKLLREREREGQMRLGRRLVAELPTDDGIVLFLEDDAGFSWGSKRARRVDLAGVRLLSNGGVVAQAARPGVVLPTPSTAGEFEGSEQWEVELRFAEEEAERVPCGRLREGVSRDAATRVFEALRSAIESPGAATR
jgi:hypothetical protein